MTDAVLVEVVHDLALSMIALTSMASSWFAYKASTRSGEALSVAKQTEVNTNHKMDQLLNLTAKASHAEGMKEAEDNVKKES